MDGKWQLPLIPTACIDTSHDPLQDAFVEIFPELRTLSTSDFIIDQVRGLTTELKNKRSYCPATWTSRAYNLIRLGYPELAAGDAYKATLLLGYHDSPDGQYKTQIAKQIWRQTKESPILISKAPETDLDKQKRIRQYINYATDRAAIVLAQALFQCKCYVECYEHLKEYEPKSSPANGKFNKLKSLAVQAQELEDLSRQQEGDYVRPDDKASMEARRSGTIFPQTYPWSRLYIQRGQDILATMNNNMITATSSRCRLGSSIVTIPSATETSAEKEAHTVGVRASVDFRPDQIVLIDRTCLSGVEDHLDRCSCCKGRFFSIELKSFECCNARYCGATCKQLSEMYHFTACRTMQDLKMDPRLELENASADTIATNDLLYRLLAHLEYNPAIHPLRYWTVGTMIPAYRRRGEIQFSLLNDVKRPTTMLTLLNVNIFTDHGLDTWVIQTIQARVRNNVRVYTDEYDHYHAAVNLLYMFFNHSCEPNVRIEISANGSSDLTAIATQRIQSGEELFINYIDDEDLSLPYAERQELLKDWTGGECRCYKCQRERLEIAGTDQDRSSSPQIVLPPDTSSDGDYEDNEMLLGGRSRKVLNRSTTTETLIENHPAVRNLKRAKSVREQHNEMFDWDEDVVDDEGSPIRNIRRKTCCGSVQR